MVSFLLITPSVFTQDFKRKEALIQKNGIARANTLASHPFGMLFYRLPHNFKARASSNIEMDINLSSGNIWGQPVVTYVPRSEATRKDISQYVFYERLAHFDAENEAYDSFTFQYDGVVKDLRLSVTIPLKERQEMVITARSFLLTDGRFPFSLVTGDRFIEFFHSNALGGEDPFGRKVLGLEKAQISYTDREGHQMTIKENEFVFSGIETAYYYYPEILSDIGIYSNIGLHFGTNLSPYNTSIDLGISLAALKAVTLNNDNQLLFGLGINLVRKKMAEFSKTQVDLGTSNLLGSMEGQIEYAYQGKRKGYHSFGINYRLQTPYNKKNEEDYYIPHNPDRIKRWHEASRHLYKFPSYWSLIYSFTRKVTFSVYLQQDFVVNNAPDLQTGIHMGIPLFSSQSYQAESPKLEIGLD